MSGRVAGPAGQDAGAGGRDASAGRWIRSAEHGVRRWGGRERGSCAFAGWAGWVIVPDMRASEIRQLIRMKPVELDATRRRLSACHNIDDLRAMGRRLTPRPVFD